MAESIKHKAVNASLWRFFEVGSRQLLSLVITTLLARMILPEQYGLIAMISVFIAVAEIFIDSGFSTALIRDNNRTQIDCSTVFYFNLLIGIICCVILQITAPYIARFYGMPELSSLTRIIALTLIVSGLGSVQYTLLAAELNFKKVTIISFICQIISGIVGIIMAYKGFQVWALVGQQMTSSCLSAIMIWFRSKWYPTFQFSIKSLKKYLKFGFGLLGSALLNTIYGKSYQLVIGKVFSSASLAFYNRAYGFTNITSQTPTSILESVTFPALCKMQDDMPRLVNGYRRMIKLSAFIVFPLCLGLGAVAYPFINVLLTSKWLFTAELLQIIVFGSMLYPIHALNLNLLKVSGKGNLFFRLEVIKKIIGIAVLCITVPIGLKAMCYGAVASSFFCLVINTYYTGKLFQLGLWVQLRDLFPIISLSIAMFIACDILTYSIGYGFISLICGICAGVIIYLGGALLFRFPQLQELRDIRK